MPAPRRFFAVAAIVMLLAVAFWFLRQTKAPFVKVEQTGAVQREKSSIKTDTARSDELDRGYDQIMTATPEDEKPAPFKTKGRVHLKPGQSAVIGFWQIGKDTNGLAVITPETLPDGGVKLVSRLLQVTDEVASAKAVRDLFPAPFDVEQYGAMEPDAMHAALDHLRNARGANVLSMPTVTTRPGSTASIAVIQMDSNDMPKIGMELHLQTSPPNADGSFDLNLGLDLN